MADYQVTLHVSQAVYERAKRIAEETAQSVEEVLQVNVKPSLSKISRLPLDEQKELTAFQLLSDETLFGITGEQMPSAVNARMVVLGERNSLGTITPAEFDEYTKLVERGNRLMLRKSWAANILMDYASKKELSVFNETRLTLAQKAIYLQQYPLGPSDFRIERPRKIATT